MAEPKWVRLMLGLACLDLDMHHRVKLGYKGLEGPDCAGRAGQCLSSRWA
jgi:hypothetical protein